MKEKKGKENTSLCDEFHSLSLFISVFLICKKQNIENIKQICVNKKEQSEEKGNELQTKEQFPFFDFFQSPTRE